MGALYNAIKYYRIHTVALTSMLFLIGYMLSGGYLFSVGAVLWWTAGIFWHMFGFAQNDLYDFELDQTDPHKEGHPHHDGLINQLQAGELTVIAAILNVGFMLTLAQNDLSRFIFAGTILFAFAYNKTSKSSVWAPVYCAVCYMLILLIPYTAHNGDLTNPIIYLVVFYIFADVVFQIAWLGSMKDYDADPYNFLKGVKNYFGLGVVMKSLQVYAAFVLWVFIAYEQPLSVHAMFVLVAAWILWFTIAFAGMMHDIVIKGDVKYGEKWDVAKLCAQHEILLMLLLIIILSPLLGWQVFVLFVICMVWFAVWNKIYWGTTVTPKV